MFFRCFDTLAHCLAVAARSPRVLTYRPYAARYARGSAAESLARYASNRSAWPDAAISPIALLCMPSLTRMWTRKNLLSLAFPETARMKDGRSRFHPGIPRSLS